MSVFLNNVSELLGSEDINEKQAIYLIFLKDEIDYELGKKDLLELVINKYVLNNKVTKLLTTKRKSTSSSSIEAIFENDISKEAYKYICTKMCNKDSKSGFLALPEGEEDLSYTASEFLDKEIDIAPMFWALLFLFPTKGEPNKRWEKAFLGDFYDGMPLRKRSKEAGNAFRKMAKEYDMGAFLLGTYRYIKESVHGGKAYVTTIPKYMKIHSEYTRVALIDIKRAKKVEELFKDSSKSKGVKNVIL